MERFGGLDDVVEASLLPNRLSRSVKRCAKLTTAFFRRGDGRFA